MLHGLEPQAEFVSARTGEGIEALLASIAAALPDPTVEVEVVIPYDRGDLVALLHERNRVLETQYVEEGTRIRARVSAEMAAGLAEFAA